MRPFKKYMLLDFDTEIKYGIWGDRITSQPWVLTIRVIDWWGLRDRIVKKKVSIDFDFDVYGFYNPKLNVWLTDKSHAG
jgi:hypothetical protein